MKIDAHQHYWLTARNDYGWLQPSSGRLYADYMPVHLKPLLAAHGISKSIIVQAAPTVAETEFMLDIASKEDSVAGVVGWLDLTSSDFEQTFQRLRKHPKFVGIRPMIQDLPSDWIVQEVVVRHLHLLANAGFPVDLQANPRHLPYILNVLEQIPHLHAVIDHLAKPAISEGIKALEPWRTHMFQIAAYPNMMCKLSGMVPEKQDEGWTTEGIAIFASHAIQAFGKKKVMFSSDWPVCLLSATYEQVIDLFEACLPAEWNESDRMDIYGGNAVRFYNITLA